MAAAALVGLAAWVAVSTWAQGGAPRLRAVVVAAGELPAGHTLTGADLTLRDVGADWAPPQALVDPGAAVGMRLAAPINDGEIVTPARLRAHTGLRGLGPEIRAIHVPLADPGAAARLRPGDHVDVIAVGPGRLVAADLVVLEVDASAEPSAVFGAGASPAGVVLAAPSGVVPALASASWGDAGAAGVQVALRP